MTVVRICVHVRILGSGLWALICLCLLNKDARPKAMVPTVVIYFYKDSIFRNLFVPLYHLNETIVLCFFN